ncbi:CerR family C-terminal domain-containing protein [Caulobacter segnis]|uniref:CerR family C-terminal domain-containing protein n=1 Tax=Caulobacter segnis TaxID=88688 RepID=UPI00285C9897|nr:CerR family C-terminal domain-containing protein [Caulobacter segnis]MDR6623989.1 AcrR family transcriptional regulator [Caulobacter segnis]
MRRRSEDSQREDAAQTRARLVDAGVKVFARHTYESASVRDIAAQAGVTVAMVGYHFKGKEGLYLAAAEHIAERALKLIGPAQVKAREVLASGAADRPALIEATGDVLRALLEARSEDGSLDWARILLREQMHPSRAVDILHERLTEPYMTVLAALLAALDGRAPERRDMIRAFSLMGQAIIFRNARHASIKLLGGEERSQADYDEMMRLMERQLRD